MSRSLAAEAGDSLESQVVRSVPPEVFVEEAVRGRGVGELHAVDLFDAEMGGDEGGGGLGAEGVGIGALMCKDGDAFGILEAGEECRENSAGIVHMCSGVLLKCWGIIADF